MVFYGDFFKWEITEILQLQLIFLQFCGSNSMYLSIVQTQFYIPEIIIL